MNENDISKIYGQKNMTKKTHIISDFVKEVLKISSAFLSYGAPETNCKNLTTKKLIDTILDKNFSNLPDEIQCEYFQEFHNRLARRLGVPAVNVFVLPNPSNKGESGLVEKRVPMDYLYDTNGKKFPNIQLEINNKQQFDQSVYCGIRFKPSSNGVENLSTLIHETRHVAQFYAGSLLFQKDQMLNENDLNAIIYMELMGIALSKLGEDTNPKGIIKNKFLSEDLIEFLRTYKLTPEEIDARKFSFEEMERLAQKGFLDNTNWKTYRGKFLADEFDSLNFVNSYAKDECPAVNFLKAKKNLINKKLQDVYQKFYREDTPKDIKEIEDSINFEKYFQSIQNYYNDLKREIRKIMVNESNIIAENSKGLDGVDQNFYYKLKYGSEQVSNKELEFYLSIGNQFINEHNPILKSTSENLNKEYYNMNKAIKKDKQEQKNLLNQDDFEYELE